jgi:hypothetical protein
MTEPGDPVQVRRTWKERLCSRPWAPWCATKTIVPQVPSSKVYIIGGVAHMHPQTFTTLKGIVK